MFGTNPPKDQSAQPTTPLPATIATPIPSPMTVVTTSLPTPTPGPFPNVMKIKEPYLFGSNKSISEATVYRSWINDLYQMFDPKETIYTTKKPGVGKK
jgi:hypothetical protein